MHFSRAKLHRVVVQLPAHKAAMRAAIIAINAARPPVVPRIAPYGARVVIPLTTVSLSTNFDSYITVYGAGAAAGGGDSLIVDSGNSVLILPYWENIGVLPGYAANYVELGTANEPWGCPAKILRGPISLATASGELFVLPNCVFYACTGNDADGERTANFGTGCLAPWSASGWATPVGAPAAMQAPLSYNTDFPYAEFDLVAAGSAAGAPSAAATSTLTLYRAAPAGYSTFGIVPNIEWMSLQPTGLSIGGTLTGWPGSGHPSLAMIDTGGGPVFLSDPDGLIYPTVWPDQTANPGWATGSLNCQSTYDIIAVTLSDGTGSYGYTIDPTALPPAGRGLTLVICQTNEYMMGQRGMNIGGISALFNRILVDYANRRVGLKPK